MLVLVCIPCVKWELQNFQIIATVQRLHGLNKEKSVEDYALVAFFAFIINSFAVQAACASLFRIAQYLYENQELTNALIYETIRQARFSEGKN